MLTKKEIKTIHKAFKAFYETTLISKKRRVFRNEQTFLSVEPNSLSIYADDLSKNGNATVRNGVEKDITSELISFDSMTTARYMSTEHHRIGLPFVDLSEDGRVYTFTEEVTFSNGETIMDGVSDTIEDIYGNFRDSNDYVVFSLGLGLLTDILEADGEFVRISLPLPNYGNHAVEELDGRRHGYGATPQDKDGWNKGRVLEDVALKSLKPALKDKVITYITGIIEFSFSNNSVDEPVCYSRLMPTQTEFLSRLTDRLFLILDSCIKSKRDVLGKENEQ